jgi:O-acetylhomoserine/O-acetylserine sulfhydrylase-like pyridoxal-dependent enzyme
MKNESKWSFDTNAIRAGEHRDPATGAHNTPIYQTATFSFETSEQLTEAFVNYGKPNCPNLYTREGNPTIDVLQEKMATLQNTQSSLGNVIGHGSCCGVNSALRKSG